VVIVNKRGPKSKYDPAMHPQLAKWMCRAGAIDEDIAKEFGVSIGTLKRWKNEYPELRSALKTSKDFIDSLVEDSLLKRALGYSYEETEVSMADDGEDGKKKKKRIKKITKQVLPDTTAQIFWLKNRQKRNWRQEPEPAVSNEGEAAKQFLDALKGKAAEEAWNDEA
jgi:hypothetical protein